MKNLDLPKKYRLTYKLRGNIRNLQDKTISKIGSVVFTVRDNNETHAASLYNNNNNKVIFIL